MERSGAPGNAKKIDRSEGAADESCNGFELDEGLGPLPDLWDLLCEISDHRRKGGCAQKDEKITKNLALWLVLTLANQRWSKSIQARLQERDHVTTNAAC